MIKLREKRDLQKVNKVTMRGRYHRCIQTARLGAADGPREKGG